MKTILCIDPGKVNMGYGIIQYNNNKYRIVRRGKIKNTIQDLKDHNLKETVLKFNQEIEDMIDTYNVTEVTMERFVSRGIRGSLSEYICIMQGILAINPKITAFNLVTAATWKNTFNKAYSLKDLYKQARKLKLEDHEIDAVMIGLYYLGKGQFFAKLSKASAREKILKRLSSIWVSKNCLIISVSS